MNDVDLSVFVVTQFRNKFCCFVKEFGKSSILFCGPEQNAMESKLELF